jgi:hypothetical protein
MKFRNVGAGRQLNAECRRSRVLVEAEQALAYIARRYADDGVAVRVVASVSPKNTDPKDTLLDSVKVPNQGMLHYMRQEFLTAAAATECIACDDLCQM